MAVKPPASFRLKNTDGDETAAGNETVDSDGDGMGDNFENRFGLNPDVDDAGEDPDGDGKSNLDEFLNQTNPLVNEGAVITIINSILLDD